VGGYSWSNCSPLNSACPLWSRTTSRRPIPRQTRAAGSDGTSIVLANACPERSKYDPFQPQRLVAALSPLSSGSKSDDRRDDRPAASSPEPADTSRRLWPHPGRVRSTRAAILMTERHAAIMAAATAAQRQEPRSRDFVSSLLPFNESAAKRRRKGTAPRRPIRRAAVADLQQSN
jgi:hypothetical protein